MSLTYGVGLVNRFSSVPSSENDTWYSFFLALFCSIDTRGRNRASNVDTGLEEANDADIVVCGESTTPLRDGSVSTVELIDATCTAPSFWLDIPGI